jgi:hypothetical protein
MFATFLFLYALVGAGLATYWEGGAGASFLSITTGLLSTLSLILPLAKGVPGLVGLLYVRVTDEERSIRRGGYRKPLVGRLDLSVSTWEDRAHLMRTALHDVFAFLAWLFVAYSLLGQGGLWPLLRFWRDVLVWLPRLLAPSL